MTAARGAARDRRCSCRGWKAAGRPPSGPSSLTAIADAVGSHPETGPRVDASILQLLAERGQRLLRVARLLDRLLRPVHADLIRDVVHRRPVVVESCSVTTTRQVARSVPETGVPLLLFAPLGYAHAFNLGVRDGSLPSLGVPGKDAICLS